MPNFRHYTKPMRHFPFNVWDIFALLFLFIILAALAWGGKHMAEPYHLGQTIAISLAPTMLPAYALQSVLRMLIAMLFSLLFTLVIATLAAKNKHAERIIIPIIDILQSVPVLGFLSITITAFIALFPNSMLGPQCACLFAIFTAQAWNMTLGFYQSLKTVPADLREAAAMFHLSGWEKFWRIEVPLAIPGLTWNAMMSMSASWVFLVAAEAISVANQNITLPGIGSYISLAVKTANLSAIFYAIAAMFIVIMLYDQLLFRPILAWSQKFRFEQNPSDKVPSSWFVQWLQRTHLTKYIEPVLSQFRDNFIKPPWLRAAAPVFSVATYSAIHKSVVIVWYFTIATSTVIALVLLGKFIFSTVPLSEIGLTFKLGCATLLRVLASVLISSLLWVPLGVWIGQRPRYAQAIQPIIQFLASFPANLLFPITIIAIIHWRLNPEIWLTVLMILSSQWYIAFNVIAGTTVLPREHDDVTHNLGVHGWLWWKRFILPGIFPYYVTGALTAAGAAWNLSVVTEMVQWGDTRLQAYGLGAYFAQYTARGDFHRIALSVAMMSLFVLTLNRLVWQPLHKLAQTKYS